MPAANVLEGREVTWRGGMRLEQLAMLEKTFAYMTDRGWVIPDWILSLRTKIANSSEE